LLPQRKRNQFKVSGVKADVSRMLMVHHQDVFVEMSTRLQTAQQEIQKLHDQLRDSNAMIRAYQRMVAGKPVTSTPLTPTLGQSPPQVQEQRMSQQ
jgi:hypothetical protein